MKITGAMILAFGLLTTFYTAITNVSHAEYGVQSKPALSMTDPPTGEWHSYIGIGITILGCAFICREEVRT